MTLRLLILVLVFSGAAWSQTVEPADYARYEGYYTQDISQGKQFDDFEQMELHVDVSSKGAKYLIGVVRFFTDLGVTKANKDCACSLHQLLISKDSLKFRSSECFGESYQFKGRFLRTPLGIRGRERQPVLEGVLLHWKGRRLIKQAVVRFLWSEGC